MGMCITEILINRGASPLELPYTLARGGPVPRSARVAHSLRSFASIRERFETISRDHGFA
jgi:hypothetical protein